MVGGAGTQMAGGLLAGYLLAGHAGHGWAANQRWSQRMAWCWASTVSYPATSKHTRAHHVHSKTCSAWRRYCLAEAYASKAPELAAFVLTTMQRFICWIDINLVGNEK